MSFRSYPLIALLTIAVAAGIAAYQLYLSDGNLGWSVRTRPAATFEQIHVKKFANLPYRSNGSPSSLSAIAYVGDQLFVVASHEGKIYEITSGRTSLWFDVKHSLGGKLRSVGAEGGLRSLAFHPNFALNGKFYTSEIQERQTAPSKVRYLSDPDTPTRNDSVVTEWTRHPDGSFSGPREVLRIGTPGPHTIKQIIFNPYLAPGDEHYGLLYIAHGDGGEWPSPLGGHNNNALGKILRIDPLESDGKAYSVPVDNPFVGDPNMLDEVYAIGLRCPHNLAFSRDGKLLAAEMGNKNVEEVNVITAGGDYGWKAREGTFTYLDAVRGAGIEPLPTDDEGHRYTYPAAQIVHDPAYSGGIAIAGGYPIENESDLDGLYIYGEFATTGVIYYSSMAEMAEATTVGPPELLTQAETRIAQIIFDHDQDPRTPPQVKTSMLDVINDSPHYAAGNTRADIRFGQGPAGEIYITSKANNTVYLVTNSSSEHIPARPARTLDLQGGPALDVKGSDTKTIVSTQSHALMHRGADVQQPGRALE